MSHLDDEVLSAHLDGEADEHVVGCAECRARLDMLRSVRAAVAAPVPLPAPERVDAAVAAAVAARVVPLQSRRRGLTALAAAAAVVAVLGSLAVLRSDDDGQTAVPTAGPSNQVAQGGSTFEGGDLGDQSDPAVLALRVKAAVEPDVGTESGAGDAASSDAQTAAPTAGGAATAKRSSSDSGPDPDCTGAVAREYATGLGPLSYKASLRWQGTPAVVLAYPVLQAKGSLDHRVLVMAREGCRLLVAQTI